MPANVEMMFSGSNMVPWHGLGQIVEGALTADEALVQAGLDWTVDKTPIYIPDLVTAAENDGSRSMIEVDGHYATVRSTDRRVLGLVQKKYVPLQNSEAFSFFDAIVSRKEAIYETAGSLDNGRRVWVLAKLPGEIVVKNARGATEDLTNKYVLIANSHDGSSGVQIKVTPIRVVCQNTLTAALKGGAFSIRHTKSVSDRVAQAAEAMGFTNKMYAELSEAWQAMADRRLSEVDAVEFFETCLKKSSKAQGGVSDNDADDSFDDQTGEPREPRAIKHIVGLYEGGAGADMTYGTLWGAYNAITEYADHKKYRTADTRLNSAWFNGAGNILKQKAFSEAVKLLK